MNCIMSNKTVKYLLPASPLDMGGFKVKQALPTQKVEQVDPFLLLHHAKVQVNELAAAKHQGVGPHPHRGFSPVTFVIQGEVHHRDSRGNSQIAKAGDVQWMNAGAGIIHSERPSDALVKENGIQEIIQLWVNSPASAKMKPPSYQFLSAEDMPTITSVDELIQLNIVAGKYENQNSPIQTDSPLLMIWGKAKKGGKQVIQVPKGYSSMLYVISGGMRIEGYGGIPAENLVVFDTASEADEVGIHCLEEGQFLLLCGQPIEEKVTQYGPFVMNSQTEIMQAMRDYQMGKMGILIED